MPSTTLHPSPLTDDDRASLRAMLEEQRAFRVEQLIALADPGTPGRYGSSHAEITTTLTRGARRALHDVQSALWRMDDGTYGDCTSCGRPVEAARLEILPQAALCMPCQRAAAA